MIDLFGVEQQTPRKNDRREAAALVEALKALSTHAAVAWCERMNSGAARMGGRFVRFGFKGCPDVLGPLKDDRPAGCGGESQDRTPATGTGCIPEAHPWHSLRVTCVTCCAS